MIENTRYNEKQKQSFKSKLMELIDHGGNRWHCALTNDARLNVRKYDELRQFIDHETPLLQNGNYTINTKVYWILNGLTDFPRCKQCGKKIKKNIRVQFDGHKGYADFCSCRCSTMNERTQDRFKHTCIERYGVDNPSKSIDVKEKIKTTHFNKYGCWNTQTTGFNEFVRKRCIEKYGVDSYSKTIEFKQKYKETIMLKYGVDNYSKTNEFKMKFKETMNRRYGVDAPIQLQQFRERINDTNIKRYGVKWISDMINIGKYGNTSRSKVEVQMFEFVKGELKEQCEILANDRTQMTPNERNGWYMNHELDIWIPDLKLAIEFQGDYWHNPNCFPQTAYNDQEKRIQCEEKNITLVQVNECDWKHNRENVELKLRKIIDEKQTRE